MIPRSRCSARAPRSPRDRIAPPRADQLARRVPPERREVPCQSVGDPAVFRARRRDREPEPLARRLQGENRVGGAPIAETIPRGRTRSPAPRRRRRPAPRRMPAGRRGSGPALAAKNSTISARPPERRPARHRRPGSSTTSTAGHPSPQRPGVNERTSIRPRRHGERGERRRGVHPIVPHRVPVRQRVHLLQRAGGDGPVRHRRLDLERRRGSVQRGLDSGTGSQKCAPSPRPVAKNVRSPRRLTPTFAPVAGDAVIAHAGSDRVARALLVGDDDVVLGAAVHGAREPGVGAAVDQHPHHAHRGVEPYGDLVRRNEPPGGLGLAEEVAAGIGGNEGDVVAESVVLAGGGLEREERSGEHGRRYRVAGGRGGRDGAAR